MGTSVDVVTAPPFTDFLKSFNRGRLLDDAAARLIEVTEAVAETGGKGTVTIKVEIKPDKNEEGAVDVTGTVTSTQPRHTRAAKFFVTQTHHLVRDNPAYEAPLVAADFADQK